MVVARGNHPIGSDDSHSREKLPVLLKNLTPARWTLLEAVKRSGPMSINELARLLERNYKNVHRRDEATGTGIY
jgi:predicted transcriptional regulator